MAVHTKTLELSRFVVQWRDDDDFMRYTRESEFERSDYTADQGWFPARERFTTDSSKMHPSDPQVPNWFLWPNQVFAGDSPDRTWWAFITAVPADASITAVLDDGTEVEVQRMGPVCTAEWVSRPQAITITVDGQVTRREPFRPGSRGTAPYRYAGQPNPDHNRWTGFTRRGTP